MDPYAKGDEARLGVLHIDGPTFTIYSLEIGKFLNDGAFSLVVTWYDKHKQEHVVYGTSPGFLAVGKDNKITHYDVTVKNGEVIHSLRF